MAVAGAYYFLIFGLLVGTAAGYLLRSADYRIGKRLLEWHKNATAVTEKVLVNKDGRRFVQCAHGLREIGTDCVDCINERADSDFSLAAQCPKCRVVAVHNVVRWEHTGYPMWTPEVGFNKAGETLIGCVRGCINCGHEWFQK